MRNPWEKISLADYENHMKLESVKQLQSLNRTVKSQLFDYEVNTVMILGVAGGNGLEHIDTKKYNKVYGIDINQSYLQAVEHRYQNLAGVLQCINVDLTEEHVTLPNAQLLIANLLIEYIGYNAFQKVVQVTKPTYVSCVIQINTDDENWVSDSPYIHSFDCLDSIHNQMNEHVLTEMMDCIGYKKNFICRDYLPNGKSLVRLDYQLHS